MIYYFLYELLYIHFKDKDWYLVKTLNVFQYVTFRTAYATITALSTKPVIVAETGSSETGGDKAAWIEESFFRTIPEQMPRVAAVIWFNDAKERDWRVNSSQASLEAWRRVVASTLYGGDQPPPSRTSSPRSESMRTYCSA